MEGNVLDVFRVVSLVVVWAIPAALVAAVVGFVLLGPAMVLGGAVARTYASIRSKLRRRTGAETPLAELLAREGLTIRDEAEGRPVAAETVVPTSEVDAILARAGLTIRDAVANKHPDSALPELKRTPKRAQ